MAAAASASGDVTLTAAEVREQLAQQNITPLKNESPEDAIKVTKNNLSWWSNAILCICFRLPLLR